MLENTRSIGIAVGGNVYNDTIENNRINQTGRDGILFIGGDYSMLLNNTISDEQGIHENCMSIYSPSVPIVSTNNILVAHNLLTGCGSGLTIEYSNNVTVYDNLIDSANVFVDTVNDWGGSTGNIVFINNDFLRNPINNAVGLYSTVNVIYTFFNNIISGGGDGNTNTITNVTANRNNNIYTGLTWLQTAGYGWNLTSNEILQANLNTIFVNPSASNFNLKLGSPAIGTGINPMSYLPVSLFPNYNFSVDLSGVARPTNGAWDIGAYQYSASTTTTTTSITTTSISTSTITTTIPAGSGRLFTVKRDGTGNYLTIGACANNAIQAGDTCAVYPGTYNELVTVTHPGTIDNPITFEAVGAVKMAGFTMTGVNSVNIFGFEMTDYGMPNIISSYSYAVYLNHANDINVSYNYIHHTYRPCIEEYPFNNMSSDNGTFMDNLLSYCNYITDYQNKGSYASSGVGVYIFGNNNLVQQNNIMHVPDFTYIIGSFDVIRNNTFHDAKYTDWGAQNNTWANGVHIDGTQTFQCDPSYFVVPNHWDLIEDNYMYNVNVTDGHGLLLQAGNLTYGTLNGCLSSDIIFRLNTYVNIGSYFILDDERYPGLRAYENTAGQIGAEGTNAIIEWTTTAFYDNSPGGQLINNLFYNTAKNSGTFYDVDASSSNGFYAGNNLVWSPTCGISCLWSSPSTNTMLTHNTLLNVNPLIVSATYPYNYSLTVNSPALNAGSPLTWVYSTDSATSNKLVVDNAGFFQSGWAGIQPDWIAVGNNLNVGQIKQVNYATNAIILAANIPITAGAPVWLYKNSLGSVVLNNPEPNIGAYQLDGVTTTTSSTSTTTISPSGSTGPGGGGGGGNFGGGGGSHKPIITPAPYGYTISNIAQKDVFNVTINGFQVNVTDNYIGPALTGITVNGKAYTLLDGTPETIGSPNPYFNYNVELVNVSYIPVLHSITLYINATPSGLFDNLTINATASISNYSIGVQQEQLSGILSMKNVTANTPAAPSPYRKISAFNLSMPYNGVKIAVDLQYPCSLNSSSLYPFILQNDTWEKINNFTLNASACALEFKVVSDPVLAVMQYFPNTTTSTVETTSIPPSTSYTTTMSGTQIQAQKNNDENGIILLIIAMAAAAVIYLLLRRRGGSPKAAVYTTDKNLPAIIYDN